MASQQLDISAQALENLSTNDKQELQQALQNQMQKDMIQDMIHKLTNICFKKCVSSSIKDGKLDRYEEPCMQNCVARYMDTNTTILKHLERMKNSM